MLFRPPFFVPVFRDFLIVPFCMLAETRSVTGTRIVWDAVNPSMEAWLLHPCSRHPANTSTSPTAHLCPARVKIKTTTI